MKYAFGEKVRAVRERLNLTLREVADRAGVSESLVSQIERNRVSPAIDTLLTLAEVLELDLEYLFEDYRKDRQVEVTRRAERTLIALPGIRYERLAKLAGDDKMGIEAYCITLEPGAATQGKEYGHPGWELGIVEEGLGELTIGGRSYELEAGDSVSFRAGAPHALRNRGSEPLRVFWILSPPKREIG